MVGTGILPVGYLAAEFLESTGTQRIVTGFAPFIKVLENIEVGFRVDAAMTESNTWKYAAGIQSNGGNFGVTTPTRTGGGVLNIYFGTQRFSQTGSLDQVLSRFVHELNYKNSRKSIFKSCEGEQEKSLNSVNNSNYTTTQSLTLFGAVDQWGAKNYSLCKIWGAEITDGNEVVRKFSPVISESGVPCMFDKITKQPFYNNGTGSFIVGMTLEQARKLSRLPKTGGTLTVSLPWEALDDARVQAALAKAAENGWTIIEQYRNPDATTENIAVDYLKLVDSCYVDPLYVPSRDGIIRYAGTFESIRSTENQPLFSNSWPRFAFQYNKTHGGLIANGADSLKSPFKCQTNLKYALEWFDSVSPVGYINGQQMLANNMTSPVPKDGFWIGCAYRNTAEYSNARHYYLSIEYDNEKAIDLVPVLSEVGEAGFYCNVRKDFYGVQGSGSFAVGFETVEAARNLAKLPKVASGELTVSLPAEARDAASMVPTAISIAVSRGWTIIEQYRED